MTGAIEGVRVYVNDRCEQLSNAFRVVHKRRAMQREQFGGRRGVGERAFVVLARFGRGVDERIVVIVVIHRRAVASAKT